MRLRISLFILSAAVAMPAAAQQLVVSPGPDSVSVTVYRAPDRGADEPIDRAHPDGFALITEKRRVRLPAGPAVVRFEGVAGNIFPETALIAGLPADVREKNMDADLLSPRSLYDRALGRRVLIRRTDRATGRVIVEQATIRSSAAGAAVLTTKDGVVAVGCNGLNETIVYDEVPAGLSAKPTLSIAADGAGGDAELTLSYLAGGFDWQASYVVRLRPDGRGADLFAWLTLASSDVTSFVDAGTQVVAGKPNRSSGWSDYGISAGGGLELKCWPLGAAPPPPPPPLPMSAPPALLALPVSSLDERDAIVVRGSRVRKAAQEDLGDLKLYRVQDRVTVASNGQKQVAMLAKEAVPLALVYVSDIYDDTAGDPVMTLRTKNRSDAGLGLPLPAGRATVFETQNGRDMLIGESATEDKAVGEDVEFKLDKTVNVTAQVETLADRKGKRDFRLSVTNANPWPIAYEAKFDVQADERFRPSKKLPMDGSRPVWRTTIPANGSATFDFRRERQD